MKDDGMWADAVEAFADDLARRWANGDYRRAEAYAEVEPRLCGDGPAMARLLAREAAAAGSKRANDDDYLGRLDAHLGKTAPADLREELRRQLQALPQTQSAALPASDLAPGTRLGRYVIRRKLGHGGMGDVYLATQDGLVERDFALKVIRQARAADDRATQARVDALNRFVREVELTDRLRHLPGVASIIDSGEDSGTAYYVMELVQGLSVRAMLEQAGRFEIVRAALLVEKLARIVHEVHNKGIVHRDLKPDNVMVDEKGSVCLVDFGIAAPKSSAPPGRAAVPAPTLPEATRLTQTGQVVGTMRYMAPERFAGLAGDCPQADVFSLGAMLWELLTGQWSEEDWFQAVHDSLDPKPLRESQTPEALERICRKALAADSSKRYQSALELDAALNSYLREEAMPQLMPLLWWPSVLTGLAGGAGAFLGRVRLTGWSVVSGEAASGWWRPDGEAFILLFAGLGGLSLALTRAGVRQRQGERLAQLAMEHVMGENVIYGRRRMGPLTRPWTVIGCLVLALAGAALGGFVGVVAVGETSWFPPFLALGAFLGVVLGACNRAGLALLEFLAAVPVAILGGLAGWASAKGWAALGGHLAGTDAWIAAGALLAGGAYAVRAWFLPGDQRPPEPRILGAFGWLRLVLLLIVFGRWWFLYAEQDRQLYLPAPVTALAATGAPNVFLTGHLDGTLRLVDLRTGRSRRLPDQTAQIQAVAVSSDGRWLATACGSVSREKDGRLGSGKYDVRVWDAVTLREVWRFGEAEGLPFCLAFNPTHPEQLAVGHGYSCVLYDVVAREFLRRVYGGVILGEEKGTARAIAFAPDGSAILVVPRGVNDVQLPPELYPLPLVPFGPPSVRLSSGSDAIAHVTYTPDGRQVVTTDFAGVVRLWDVKTGGALRQLRNDHGGVTSVAVSPDGRRLLAATRKRVVLWNLETGEQVRSYVGHQVGGATVAVFTHEGYAVSGGLDGFLRVWRLPP